jgi:2,3,4,5-tetrahydropyridine-2-carboxylate N-succinyltransferase
MSSDVQAVIEAAWDARDTLGFGTTGEIRDAVEHALAALDAGEARVAEKVDGDWVVNQWLKKAVLLSFRLNDNVVIEGPGRNSPAGARTASAPPVSARCRAASSVVARSSTRASC